MPVNADDLPVHVRARIVEPNGRSASSRFSRNPPTGKQPYRCHQCPAEFDDYGAAAERHLGETGHTRLDAVLSRLPTS